MTMCWFRSGGAYLWKFVLSCQVSLLSVFSVFVIHPFLYPLSPPLPLVSLHCLVSVVPVQSAFSGQFGSVSFSGPQLPWPQQTACVQFDHSGSRDATNATFDTMTQYIINYVAKWSHTNLPTWLRDKPKFNVYKVTWTLNLSQLTQTFCITVDVGQLTIRVMILGDGIRERVTSHKVCFTVDLIKHLWFTNFKCP